MPWKFREAKEYTPWHSRPLGRIALVILLCGSLAAVPYTWDRYRRWNERRRLGRAHEAFVRGDLRQALIEARGVLRADPHSRVATEIIERSMAALQAPEAMSWRRMQSAMATRDPDQLLGLAEAFVRAEDFASAAQALEKVKAEDRKSARFQRVAATVAAKNGDSGAALSHWSEAVRLAPADLDSRLQLAALHLASDQSESRAAALLTIEEIKATPMGRAPALRTLLDDATRRDDKAEAREIALQLAADPDAEFSDKLALLTILQSIGAKRDEEFSAYLAQLQKAASAEPMNIFTLMSWMTDHDLALLVPEWENQLPPEVTTAPPVAPAIAAALVRAVDWKRLKEKTESATWSDMEFLRLAFLALALDRLGDWSGGIAAWNNALDEAQTRPELLERLAQVTSLWGWKERTEEVLWKLAPSEWCPRWAMDTLWSAAMARGDTAKLYEVSKLRLKTEPESAVARNNHLALALLAGQRDAATFRLAETLFKDNPKDAFAASTYGFALYQQGRAKEAAALLETFKPEELRVPAVAQYYGIFLAASGQTDRAEEYLRLGAQGPQLPEERSLVAFFAALCRTRSLDGRGDEAAARVAWDETLSAAGDRTDRLELLAKMALDWGWQARAEAAFWKLSTEEGCPRWVIDSLWAIALKSGSSADRYKASKLVLKADPRNLRARGNSIILALLTGQETDAPQRQAETFYQANISNPEAIVPYCLSLYLQDRVDEAIMLMAALSPEQLREPRAALYYALLLASSETPAKALDPLRIAASNPMFPEERALLEKAVAVEPLKAVWNERPRE